MLEVLGDKGAIRWWEGSSNELVVISNDGKREVYKDENAAPGALGGVDTPFGGSDAYIEALARVYHDYAEFLAGGAKDAGDRVMGMTPEEGLRSIAVIDAVSKSMLPPREGEPPVPKWIPVVVPKV